MVSQLLAAELKNPTENSPFDIAQAYGSRPLPHLGCVWSPVQIRPPRPTIPHVCNLFSFIFYSLLFQFLPGCGYIAAVTATLYLGSSIGWSQPSSANVANMLEAFRVALRTCRVT
jgi:hypothetical protein